MTHRNQTLDAQIESLVREHIETMHQAAAASVERAFGSTPPTRAKVPSSKPPRATSPRRTPSELAALGERLNAAVLAEPGETMAVIAPSVGATPSELHLPMTTLKAAGRVRSVGQRHQTRYYPTSAGRQ